MHRSYRPSSPSRRGAPPGRSSTSALDSPTQANYSTSTRDNYSSPRTSLERVIPISEKTYVNGKLVKSTVPDSGYDSHSHQRRGTYDGQTSASGRYHSSSNAAPPVVHNSSDRPSDVSRSAKYDGYYATPASSGPRQHRKTYSVDNGGTSRLLDPARDPKRLVELDRANSRQRRDSTGARDSRSYHLSGHAPRRTGIEDYAGYEYSEPREIFETTEPVRSRPRRGSVGAAGSRERPNPMYDGFGPPARASTHRDGPPVSMRGFDKINGGATRHGSIQDNRGRSPQRFRERGSGSFSEDDGFPVAPRMAERSGHRDGSRDYYSPVNDRFDDRRQSRPTRFEDKDLVTRGFGVRTSSIEPPSRARGPSIDRRPNELPLEPPYRREIMPAEPSPRDAGFPARKIAEPSGRRDVDRREPDRAMDREPLRVGDREYQLRDRERDITRNRDYDDDRQTTRDRDYPSGRGSSRYDDGPARRERRDYEPAERRATIDDPPSRRDRGPRDDQSGPSSSLSSMLPAAMAGAAGLYAASKGKQHLDREKQRDDPSRDKDEKSGNERNRDDRPREERSKDDKSKDDRTRDRDERTREDRKRDERSSHPEDRESTREEAPLQIEAPPRHDNIQDMLVGQREQAAPPQQPVPVEKPRMRRTSTEDSPPRVRHYVDKEAPSSTRSGQPSEQSALILDPDEDYKRRVQAELERTQRPRDQEARDGRLSDFRDSDSERERQRRAKPQARGVDTPPSSQEAGPTDTSRALAPYQPPEEDRQILDEPLVDEPGSVSERSASKRVAIVEPPRENAQPKGILRQPTQKFPEELNPEREGVAPLKPVPGVPPNVKWTKIDRVKVNPETLEEAKERFEERMDHVIVLRVVDHKQIEKWARRTEEIRTARYEYKHRHDSEQDKEARRDREKTKDRERRREHDDAGPSSDRRHRRERRHHHDHSSDDS